MSFLVAAATACASGAPRNIQSQALVDQSKATVELFKARNKDSTALFNAALRDARGIIIFPDVFEAAVGVGGQGGSGVMVARDANGTWGYPAFYRISGGSLGIQLGAQSTEVIFLLMTDDAVKKVIDSPSQFGIGAQATFGEIGGGGSSATTSRAPISPASPRARASSSAAPCPAPTSAPWRRSTSRITATPQ